jgi:hypothetical protein
LRRNLRKARPLAAKKLFRSIASLGAFDWLAWFRRGSSGYGQVAYFVLFTAFSVRISSTYLLDNVSVQASFVFSRESHIF